jgi:hypothetical protein
MSNETVDSIIYVTGAITAIAGALVLSVAALSATWWLSWWLLKRMFSRINKGPAVWTWERPYGYEGDKQKVAIHGWGFNIGNRMIGFLSHSVEGVDKSRKGGDPG